MATSACNSKEYLSVFLEIKYSGYIAEVPFAYFLSHHTHTHTHTHTAYKNITYEISNIYRIFKHHTQNIKCTQGSRFNKTNNFYCFIKDTQVK